METRTGFIGLGRMGGGMAANLQRKGHGLVVHDIRNEPVERLVGLGAENGGSLRGVAEACGAVFTILPGPREVQSAILGPDGLLEHCRPGQLIVDMSTVDPETTDSLAAACSSRGVGFADAPVGRLASHADAGESLFMVGAGPADFERVKPLLEAMGTTIYHCGPPGAGTRTKLINNYLAIVSCQLNAEVLTLAKAFGLKLQPTLDVIHGTTATNGQLKLNYATKVFTGDTEPGFAIDLAHKDLTLILNAANAARVATPIAAAAREAVSLARAGGYGGKDFSALLDHWCERSAQPPIRLDDGREA